jgi:hypothetical protein
MTMDIGRGIRRKLAAVCATGLILAGGLVVGGSGVAVGAPARPRPTIDYNVPIDIGGVPASPNGRWSGFVTGIFDPGQSKCTSSTGLASPVNEGVGFRSGHFRVSTAPNCFLQPAVATFQVAVTQEFPGPFPRPPDRRFPPIVLTVTQVAPGFGAGFFVSACTDVPDLVSRCSVVAGGTAAVHVLLKFVILSTLGET